MIVAQVIIYFLLDMDFTIAICFKTIHGATVKFVSKESLYLTDSFY
jgi:hypothetical protein